MLPLIITCVLAIGISFVCSFTEAALYSLPLSHIERLRQEKGRVGELLFNIRGNIEKPITAVLTLNTIANTAGATIAGSYAASLMSDVYTPIFAIAFTLAILLFSEIIPKTLGVIYCRQASSFLAFFLTALLLILRPLIFVLSSFTRLITPKNATPPATAEDVTAIAGILRRSGQIQRHEEAVIKNILGLDRKVARDIMTPRTVIISLAASMTVLEAQKSGALWNYSRIPVYGDDNEDLIGIVSRRRILEELAADRDDRLISDIMLPIHFVVESTSLDRLLLRFLDKREHLYAVLDEFGGLAGLVTLEDVLEEILGREIVDETDAVPDLRELARQRREMAMKWKT